GPVEAHKGRTCFGGLWLHVCAPRVCDSCGKGHACLRSAKALERAGDAADAAYALTNASAPAESKICEKASGASACLCVLRGCMCLLSLTATCQVCIVPLKAGLYSYNRRASDGWQRPLVPRFHCQPRLTPSVGRRRRRTMAEPLHRTGRESLYRADGSRRPDAEVLKQ